MDAQPFLDTLKKEIRPGDIPMTNGEFSGKTCPICGTKEISNKDGDVWCLGWDCNKSRRHQMRNTYKIRS